MGRMHFAERPTFTSRDVRAGCFVCHGLDAHWFGGNAQGVAAQHHDRTKHAVWCDVQLSIRYGEDAADPRQIDLEAAIAAASSGSAPECAPLPDPDAPAAVTAGVSAHQGRSVETAGSCRPGARGATPEPIHA